MVQDGSLSFRSRYPTPQTVCSNCGCAADGKPVRPWEHQVEQNQVKRTLERRALTVGAVCADGDGAAAQLEIVALDGGDVGIVLDNQYFRQNAASLQEAA